ncbi:MAG: aromatic ring-hydroxylating dioxygenase subunit alpha [Chloroflexota bacterium]
MSDPVLINDWHPVAAVVELNEKNPLPVRLLGEDLVVWRADGEICVWRDLCIHRGAKLSRGNLVGSLLACPYHGWRYNVSGRCEHIPAHPEVTPPTKAKAQTYPIEIKYGLIWTTLGDPKQPIPTFDEWENKTYRNIPSGPYFFEAAGPRVIENFLDVSHFPFVHAGSLGDPHHPEIQNYRAEITEDGIIAKDITVWQPDPDGTGVGGDVTYTYKVFRPLCAYFVKTKGPSFAAMYAVCPIDESHTKGWVLMSMNYGWETPEADIIAFQDRVTGEDIPVVESQRPELLPLDLQAELHLKSDRTAIAYRRWLKQLGVTYGTE